MTPQPAHRNHKRPARMALARALLRLAFQAIRPKRLYEPIQLGGRKFHEKRETDARWTAIAEIVREYKVRNVLDIGCAEGWFLRRAAEDFGCFAIGVEAGNRRVLLGEIARLHDGVERIAVIQADLKPADIRNLPICDLVLCLSVVHHVMREGGVAAAEEFIRALATRTHKALLFEMGTSEEVELSWTKVLPEMPEGQEAFIRSLLHGSGLTNIRVVAITPGLKQDASRLLFAAEPPEVAT